VNPKDLANVLKLTEPALKKSKGVMEIFEHFCFEDDLVYANCDDFYIGIECNTGFTGGIRPEPLMSWLNTTKARKGLEIEQTESQVQFKAGRHRVTCATYTGKFLPPPEIKEENISGRFKFDKGFQQIVKTALKYTGSDAAKPELISLTFYLQKNPKLYATDEATVARFDLPKIEVEEDQRLVVPTMFFNSVLSLISAYPDNKVLITFGKDFVDATIGKTARVFSHLYLTEEDILIDFPEMFDEILGEKESKLPLVDFPKGFGEVLKLSSIISEKGDSGWASLDIKDGRMMITSNSSVVHGLEKMKLKGDHPDRSIKYFKASYAHKGLKDTDKFCALEFCLAFKGDGFFYLVSNGED
jgi:hypothetical protein